LNVFERNIVEDFELFKDKKASFTYMMLEKHSLSSSDAQRYFCNVWNRLSERSSTRKTDIYIILAFCLSLRAGEVASLYLGRRKISSSNTKKFWIPPFPEKKLKLEGGWMKRQDNDQGIGFQLKKSSKKAFRIHSDAFFRVEIKLESVSPSLAPEIRQEHCLCFPDGFRGFEPDLLVSA
jgi:hypothetical protein